MTGERDVSKLVEAYGARRERWPVDMRLDASPGLADALAREAALDALLDADAARASLPPALRARLIASGRAASSHRPAFAVAPRWARAASVAVTLMAGAVAGYAGVAAAVPSGASLLGFALTEPADPFAAFLEDDA